MSTVAAISTAQGQGGIGIIRISGKDSFAIADKIFKSVSKKKVQDIPGYTALFGYVYKDKEIIDEAVVLKFAAPKSFTGENVVEISCHGGLYVTKEVLSAVISAGAEPAGWRRCHTESGHQPELSRMGWQQSCHGDCGERRLLFFLLERVGTGLPCL